MPGIILRALLPGAFLLLAGCATGVTPPASPVEDPRRVFLLDHGWHASLVLTTPEGDLVRYAYGDWRYYAERDTSLGSGLAALFRATPATLGRRELPGPSDPGVVCRRVRVPVETLFPLEVSGARVDALRNRLDRRHAEGAEGHKYVPAYDLTFAPLSESYRLPTTSNSRVARWLRSLGAEVTETPLLSHWTLGGPDAEPPHSCPP
ncbi:MAG: hypothetical protein ACLFRB_02015 [Thiohalorhabdus sp.]|uniref:hypothetical protein n=1 Tax=Thiohalorhabdus sp. TaxID=3094134 RepID=UPI0039818F72